MNNHFYMAYCGNKRNEVILLYDNLNFDNITTIIEPFCGSCAMSYYIALKHPNKFKYILNDNNDYLKQIYEIIKNDKIDDFDNEIIKITSTIKNKEIYDLLCKEKNIYAWFIKNKFYRIRPGLFDKDEKYDKYKSLKKYPVYNFFKNENIEFYSMDGLDCYKLYKDNQENLILIDPPYMNSCNSLYKSKTTNIYEYLFFNKITSEKSYICLILENNWIIQLLFNDIVNKIIYDKKYQLYSKRETKHIIIINH